MEEIWLCDFLLLCILNSLFGINKLQAARNPWVVVVGYTCLSILFYYMYKTYLYFIYRDSGVTDDIIFPQF